MVKKLAAVIPAVYVDASVAHCVNGKYSNVYIKREMLPASLARGGVSVNLSADSLPVEIEYHFQHRVLPDDPILVRLQRILHALILDRKLNELYGSPLASGGFDEYSPTGFVVDAGKRRPCRIWIKDRIGIMLCFQRVIYTDGVEMALTFTHLDRAPMGRKLECMVQAATECSVADNASEIAPPVLSYESALKTLAAWVDRGNSATCEKDDLQPIDSVWSLSAEDQAIAEAITDKFQGDALAQYAFDNADDLGGEISEERRQKILMRLFQVAASQGSAAAMNEIGASLMYCYQGVERNIELARLWLEKAAALGDVYAMKSLALMSLLRLTETQDNIAAAEALLERCSIADRGYCAEELEALAKVTKVFNE
ncbi:MAG: hypothetical protein A3E78_06265 [Alphaproteobacteria bacterium RIFCSPHIGHO2_12_FULL_63_12]|nr:MAG: hypothetical protein A3E78_06265 [Alphaproteobacteria bacterium RIFCSPHIGHO2_12_FULL_63_12]